MIGQTVGHYSIVEKLGEGGMGVVYKARDLLLERFVALKLLPAGNVADEDRRRRFTQEARAASALNHPNIITIHDIAEHEGQTFIVMELVEGKPLSELIPRKGMRLTEALRIATQTADALTAAHAAGIVHRDLKPANIMLDARGRVKVLDFGLAKLSVTDAEAPGVDDATRTLTVAQPRTEEGVILGSVPYMSPEQAEGKPLDARTDIFSLGAVLYEMITGQRAFRGESRASTLAAVVETEPPPPSEIVPGTPPELDRLIGRCLRKDVNRRSQSMADVKLALEELRDDSESGKLVRSGATTPAHLGKRRWLWPVVAVACAIVAAGAIAWTNLNRRSVTPSGTADLVRLSPDDGYSYRSPNISADGKFVAYVSDRGGSPQLWLQQVAGGDPIQLTHSSDPVSAGVFSPDGARLFYSTDSADGRRSNLAIISTLGGQPRAVGSTGRVLMGKMSPDGRQAAYYEIDPSPPTRVRLMLRDLDGGEPRELTNWTRIQPMRTFYRPMVWTRDNRYVLCVGSKRPGAPSREEWEWFALPVDEGSPRETGAGEALRAAGLTVSFPTVALADRVLFAGGRGERMNVWDIRISPDSWRVRGAPRQLTFGTENQVSTSVSGSGIAALQIFKPSADLFLIPVSPATGQPTGVTQRLTRDGRVKLRVGAGGDPGRAYFTVPGMAGDSQSFYALDLTSGNQTLVVPEFDSTIRVAISPDGHRVAFSIPEGNSYSIRIGDAGAPLATARSICRGCGWAMRFSVDGRFLFVQPEATVKTDPKRKGTVRLLDLASGRNKPWLEHPTDSITGIGTFGVDTAWIAVRLQALEPRTPGRWYILPWKEEPVATPEWIAVKLLPEPFNYCPNGNFFQFFDGVKPMIIRFDPKTRAFTEPYEVKYVPGTTEMLKPTGDSWGFRGPGLVFSRRQPSTSIWLMKLPE